MRVLVDTNILLQGVKVYDARLVAIMNVYAVESILSFNDRNVRAFPHDAAAVLAVDGGRVIEPARQIVMHGFLLVTSPARSARRVP